ncbi:hypothetical protein ACS0TY_017488 [Phlomoides rotata]
MEKKFIDGGGGRFVDLQRRMGDSSMAVVVGVAEEGFVGSYYEAKMVAHLPKNGYVVQYATLVTDDLSAPLKEATSDAEVRQRPPLIRACEYRPYDVVDAFDNDGWWVGRITGRAAGDSSMAAVVGVGNPPMCR